jgi:hypothetical protein
VSVPGQIKILGREPTLWIGAIAGLLSLGTSLGLDGLSTNQVGAIIAAINAVAAVAMAVTVRPIGPAVFTQLVAAVAALVGAYGFNVSSEVVGAVNVGLLAVLTLLTRGHVSPTGATQAVAPAAAPVVRTSPSPPPAGG